MDAHPRWVDAENFHLTLVFLGSTDEKWIPRVCELADEVAGRTRPFFLELTRVELFPPNARQPKVISVVVGGEKREMVRLYDALAMRLSNSGFPVERRDYKPHLTLARLPSIKTAARIAPIVTAHSRLLNVKFPVEEFVLFESVSEDGAVRYVPLYTGRLQGA